MISIVWYVIVVAYLRFSAGKFHMAEVLLQSAKDQALSETLAEEGQNIWHIIADFKPFDK
jgi:hypothetical protein